MGVMLLLIKITRIILQAGRSVSWSIGMAAMVVLLMGRHLTAATGEVVLLAISLLRVWRIDLTPMVLRMSSTSMN